MLLKVKGIKPKDKINIKPLISLSTDRYLKCARARRTHKVTNTGSIVNTMPFLNKKSISPSGLFSEHSFNVELFIPKAENTTEIAIKDCITFILPISSGVSIHAINICVANPNNRIAILADNRWKNPLELTFLSIFKLS
jgi:hypothetical protein